MKMSASDRKWLKRMKVRVHPFVYRAHDNSGNPWGCTGFTTEDEAKKHLKHHAEILVSTPKKGIHQKIFALQPDGSFVLIYHVLTIKESQ